jgi:tetrahydromethanopterin S-methyltransferase subunit G
MSGESIKSFNSKRCKDWEQKFTAKHSKILIVCGKSAGRDIDIIFDDGIKPSECAKLLEEIAARLKKL